MSPVEEYDTRDPGLPDLLDNYAHISESESNHDDLENDTFGTHPGSQNRSTMPPYFFPEQKGHRYQFSLDISPSASSTIDGGGHIRRFPLGQERNFGNDIPPRTI